jgi:hypothetical protein
VDEVDDILQRLAAQGVEMKRLTADSRSRNCGTASAGTCHPSFQRKPPGSQNTAPAPRPSASPMKARPSATAPG